MGSNNEIKNCILLAFGLGVDAYLLPVPVHKVRFDIGTASHHDDISAPTSITIETDDTEMWYTRCRICGVNELCAMFEKPYCRACLKNARPIEGDELRRLMLTIPFSE